MIDPVTAIGLATTAFNGSGVEVKANAYVSLAAVSFEATLTVSDQIDVSGSASVTLDDVSATISVGDLTIAIVSFDYEAVKENYNRLRTVYIKEITDNVTRTVYVLSLKHIVVYIEPQPSNERTVLLSSRINFLGGNKIESYPAPLNISPTGLLIIDGAPTLGDSVISSNVLRVFWLNAWS